MIATTGDIGRLILDNEQVGGFKNWTTIIHIEPKIQSVVRAAAFWMLKKPSTSKFTAEFYRPDNDGNPYLVLKKEAIVHLPKDYQLDKLIVKPIEITFEEDFDWRDE